MQIVLVESPFRSSEFAETIENMRYLAWCMIDSLSRGEVPIASHGIYPYVLPETKEGRALGLLCRDELAKRADVIALYEERGSTLGMIRPVGDEKCVRRVLTGQARAGYLRPKFWPPATLAPAAVRLPPVEQPAPASDEPPEGVWA